MSTEIISQAPVIVIVMITLAVILMTNSLGKRLLPALICGTLLLAVWTGHGFNDIIETSLRNSLSFNNLMLFLTIFQVMSLSHQMEISGVMDELVSSVRGKLSKRGAMAALPGLIGFLPMPGGALFSAPMLQGCDPENHIDSRIKAQTNHWFRHVWECWWPMFPGVLLTMELTDFDVPQMLLLGLPISLVSIWSGYLLLLRRIPLDKSEREGNIEKKQEISFWSLARLMAPIIIVIATYAVVRGGHAYAGRHLVDLPNLNRYLPINIGLLLAILFLQYRRPLKGESWKKIALSWQIFSFILVVLTVRIYSGFIESETAEGYYLIEQMRMELSNWGIPVIAVIMILPFITGLATGMAVGYIGASFPIVLSLIGEDPSFGEMLSKTVLAYGFGYMGFLLSPVHVCLVVSSEHFKTDVLRNIIGLLPPALLLLLSVLGLSLLWHILL